MQFILSETDDVLVSHSGLALAGGLLQGTPLVERLSAIEVAGSRRPAMPHGEVLVSMIGLLCLGKSDYADIEAFRHETFFAQALGLRRLPSEETLRQRLDQLGSAPLAVLHEESADMIGRHAPPLVPCHRQYVPLESTFRPSTTAARRRRGWRTPTSSMKARRYGLGLWRNNPWRFIWQRLYQRFASQPGTTAVRYG